MDYFALGIVAVIAILLAIIPWLFIKNHREEENRKRKTLETIRARFGGKIFVKKGPFLAGSIPELTGSINGRNFSFRYQPVVHQSLYGHFEITIETKFPFECYLKEKSDSVTGAFFPNAFPGECEERGGFWIKCSDINACKKFVDRNGDIIRKIFQQSIKLRYIGGGMNVVRYLWIEKGFVCVTARSFDSEKLIEVFQLLEQLAKKDSEFK